VRLDSLRIALLAPHTVPEHAASKSQYIAENLITEDTLASPALLADITTAIVSVGGLVVVPQNQHGLLRHAAYMKRVIEHQLVEPSLSYGQRPAAGGLHIMQVR
jgi:hypothetical protein